MRASFLSPYRPGANGVCGHWGCWAGGVVCRRVVKEPLQHRERDSRLMI